MVRQALAAVVLGAGVVGCGDSGGPGHVAQPMDFYVAFPANNDLTQTASLSLRIAGPPGVTGSVSAPGLSFAQNFTADTAGLAGVNIPTSAMLNAWDTVQARGVMVHADDSVTVLAVNMKTGSMHATILLPAAATDTAFTVMSGGYDRPGSFLAIAARQATTSVTITPTATAGARAAGAAFTIILNVGDAYQLEATDTTGDLTGTRIHADKPISVFGGHSFANVPSGPCCAGLLWTSVPPHASIAGNDFIALPLAGRSEYRLRVVALQPSTSLASSGIPGMATTLSSAGQFVEAVTTTAGRITSDKPILVAQLAEGYTVDGTGNVAPDPCLSLLPPIGRYGRSVRFAPQIVQAPLRYANVVIPTAAAASVQINGGAPGASFTAIGATGYSGAALPLTGLVNRITAGQGFGAFVYAWDTLPGANGVCFTPRPAF